MFTDDDIRASHTIRIFGTNKDKEVLQDIWLDIERIDVFRVTSKIDGHFQGIYRKLYWFDDPDAPDYLEGGNPARTEGLKKLCSPDETDQEDPEQWVPVRTIIEMSWNESTDANELKATRGNRTDAENLVRAVAARRCFHRDTIIDDQVKAATDADPTLKAYVVASNKYDFTDVDDKAKQDKDQFIEVQYVSFTLDTSSAKEDEGRNQGVQTSLKNIHYLNFTDKAKGPVNPVHGFDPPWALDPFQAIVNVQWSPLEEAVLGITSPPLFLDAAVTETSVDGLAWETGFDGTTSNAATGLGKTVVCSGVKFIAFGKPRDGDGCFVIARGRSIERGIPDDHGDLAWSTVATLPEGDGALSCSFAGGAFFVSYTTEADLNLATYLAVSFDGETFLQGINAFNGVVAAANGTGMDPGDHDPGPVGGNVAYDKENKVYVTTGSYNRGYWNQESIGGGATSPSQYSDQNFMSAVSSDGTIWVAKFDTSECSGFPPTASGGIGGSRDGKTNVTFGNGMFVAATSFKLNYDFFTSPTFAPYKLTAYAAAVATSTDGIHWINQRLPGSASSGWVYGVMVDSGGRGTCARFFKTKKNDSGVAGFFVTTALEFLEGGTAAQNKLWQSEDGNTWTLVRTDSNKNGWILSTINKSRGTIVYRE
jgi:hypothetical protein